MKYSVLTFITNNYEHVRELKVIDPEAEYVLVTDNRDLKSNTWKVIYEPLIDNKHMTGISKALLIKYNSNKYVSNDVFIRMDHSVEILSDISPLIKEFIDGNYDVMAAENSWVERTFYDEYWRWENWRNTNPHFRERFFEKMSGVDYNFNWQGLFETTMQFYRKSDELNNFFEDMIDGLFDKNFCDGDPNDQCYNTCLLQSKYLNKLKVWQVSNTIYQSKYFQVFKHNTKDPVNTKRMWFEECGIQNVFWRGDEKYIPIFEKGPY